MRTLIEVTREDIEAGVCGSPYSCPIAKAVKRHKGDVQVRVDEGNIFIAPDPHPVGFWSDLPTYRMPTRAKRFIKKFDRYEDVQPFKFFLELAP